LQNYKVIIQKLKICDFYKAKPFHVLSLTKRRNYRLISDNWPKLSLPEFLRKATLIINIFADAPDIEEG
jgi:hypothetical protein